MSEPDADKFRRNFKIPSSKDHQLSRQRAKVSETNSVQDRREWWGSCELGRLQRTEWQLCEKCGPRMSRSLPLPMKAEF